MSKPNIVDFMKSIFSAQGGSKRGTSLERSASPNPVIVGFIFTLMFIVAMIFILL